MTEADQRRLLARTFFSRMFESDVMPSGMPQTQIVFSMLALLAGPGLAVPVLFAKKYIGARPPAVLQAAMSQDRVLVLMLAMLATAMATLILAEKVFPDRRDCRTLGVLPIAPRTFVRARLASILAVFALLFAGSTAVWAAMLGTVQGMFGSPGGVFGSVGAQFLAMASLEAAVFFGILGVQCVIVSLAGPSLAQRLAVAMQVLLVVITLQLPLLLPGREAFVATSGAPGWSEPSTLWSLPPLWFLALHDAITTGGHERTRAAAWVAVACASLLPLLALGFYAASYRRLTRLAIEGRPGSAREAVRPLHAGLSRILSLLANSPASAAVCAFTARTLARSHQHRMFIAIWLGVAIALIVSSIVPLIVRPEEASLEHPRAAILVAPLILMTLIATGMRALYALPTEIRANWVFRLNEPLKPTAAVEGAAAALVLCAVMPSSLLALMSAGWFWGPAVGVQHAAFTAVLGVLLAQVLMRGLDKIPFTCTYVPGKARVTHYWLAYLLAFSTFTYGMAGLEADLFGNVRLYLGVTGVLASIAGLLWWMRMKASRQIVSLRFQEEEDDQPTLLLQR